MDYGENLKFSSIVFVLLNKRTYPKAEFYMVARMYGTKITIVDYKDSVVHVAREDLDVNTKIDTIADQTYKIELGGVTGRKVKFATQQIDGKISINRKMQIVEAWVEIIVSKYDEGE